MSEVTTFVGFVLKIYGIMGIVNAVVKLSATSRVLLVTFVLLSEKSMVMLGIHNTTVCCGGICSKGSMYSGRVELIAILRKQNV